MSENSSTIYDFTFQLIADFFKRLNRQGPGSEDVTLKALSYIDNLSEKSRIADIGCGTGTQSLTLAQNTRGHITAIDIMDEMIERLDQRIELAGLQNRMTTIVESMDNLPFAEEELDLIWAEGSIYNIGYEKGLKEWNKYLKKGGYIAVSESTWLTPERPLEIEKFWVDSYPEIDVTSVKIRQMKDAGYLPVTHFILPDYCWDECFHALMPSTMDDFLTRNGNTPTAKVFIEMMNYEIELRHKYKEYYGYVFYIGRKL